MKNLKTILAVVATILALVILGVFAFNSVQNKAIGLEEQIRVADSDIKVQEKRRVDLVYNLVDTEKISNKEKKI